MSPIALSEPQAVALFVVMVVVLLTMAWVEFPRPPRGDEDE